jgi:hypothetical protein
VADAAIIGQALPTVTAHVEPGRMRAFRRAIGARDVSDQAAPLTYLFALEMLDAERPLAFVEDIGIDIARVLHSEQAFTYLAPVKAGDTLTMSSTVSNVTEKKGGALVFIVQDTKVTNQRGVHVADLRRTLVVRR